MTREESWADKLAHDMEYIADRSVRLYLRVLAATASRVVGRMVGRNRNRPEKGH
jgi:lipopolysaccharide/colanic/teichoic acid biosynthesis glycosyltransferase